MSAVSAPAAVHVPSPPLSGVQVKDHLSLIAEMTMVFSESHSFATVAKSALERIAKHVGAEASSLFMLDDQGSALVCTACYGPVDITGLRIPSTAGIVGRAVQKQEAQIVRDVSADADFGALVDALRTARTFDTVAMPEMKLNRDYEVMGSLRKLENDISQGGGRAVVEMELGLRKVSGNKVLLLKVYSGDVAAAGSDMPAVVAAFSTAVGQILGQFIGELGQIQG